MDRDEPPQVFFEDDRKGKTILDLACQPNEMTYKVFDYMKWHIIRVYENKYEMYIEHPFYLWNMPKEDGLSDNAIYFYFRENYHADINFMPKKEKEITIKFNAEMVRVFEEKTKKEKSESKEKKDTEKGNTKR